MLPTSFNVQPRGYYPMTKTSATAKGKSEVYDSRENWPPYTYRDYPDIKPETYESFMQVL